MRRTLVGMTIPLASDGFAAGVALGALGGVLAAPALWRWVGLHAWRAADREARLDEVPDDLSSLDAAFGPEFDPAAFDDRYPAA